MHAVDGEYDCATPLSRSEAARVRRGRRRLRDPPAHTCAGRSVAGYLTKAGHLLRGRGRSATFEVQAPYAYGTLEMLAGTTASCASAPDNQGRRQDVLRGPLIIPLIETTDHNRSLESELTLVRRPEHGRLDSADPAILMGIVVHAG